MIQYTTIHCDITHHSITQHATTQHNIIYYNTTYHKRELFSARGPRVPKGKPGRPKGGPRRPPELQKPPKLETKGRQNRSGGGGAKPFGYMYI